MACIDHNQKGDKDGYGELRRHGRFVRAHRVALMDLHVPIAGMVVRHLCHNPRCINPDHLTVGTQADNIRDALKRGTHRGATEQCPAGHPYDESNTYWRPDRVGRICRTCRSDAARRYRARKAA